ncbi:ArsR/SmtB family transcription factor [Bdellovibrio sp. HCB337]|uniref:ArsR/SmtB family transcription factor n=1 Tax=Bdellovibrio sp. HCB337 TaxID=3394358 RepID=UPI0039A6BE5E
MDPCSEKLKILSNPQRLKILEIIAKDKLNVSEINEKIDIPQNLLSYHLKVLEENEFIEGVRAGKHIIYQKTANLSSQGNKLSINLKCCELKF